MVFTNIPGGNRITKGIIIAEGKTINTQMKGGEKSMNREIEHVENIHPIDCMHRTINLLAQKAETADTETLLNIAALMTEMYEALSTIVE